MDTTWSDARINGVDSQRTSQVELLKDVQSWRVTVSSTSKTLEELLTAAGGSALGANAMGVTLVIGSVVLNYNPDGEATANHGNLPSVYSIWGDKTDLDAVQLFHASSATITIITHESNDENIS